MRLDSLINEAERCRMLRSQRGFSAPDYRHYDELLRRLEELDELGLGQRVALQQAPSLHAEPWPKQRATRFGLWLRRLLNPTFRWLLDLLGASDLLQSNYEVAVLLIRRQLQTEHELRAQIQDLRARLDALETPAPGKRAGAG